MLRVLRLELFAPVCRGAGAMHMPSHLDLFGTGVGAEGAGRLAEPQQYWGNASPLLTSIFITVASELTGQGVEVYGALEAKTSIKGLRILRSFIF